jgi:hypothetical protein
VFDVHTLLLGSLCAILGSQVVWLWLHAQVYGWTSGLWPPDRTTERLFRPFRLERWLIIGAGLLVAGLGLNGWLLFSWIREGLGPLDVEATLRFALWGFTAMILGAQTIFGSFFLGMIQMAGAARARAESEIRNPKSEIRIPKGSNTDRQSPATTTSSV